MSDDGALDLDALLDEIGFDEDASGLTRRQAEVLALRERGLSQAAIADLLGTSRANVSGVESSARRNVERARETVAFAEALAAPVRVQVPAGTNVYDVPVEIYEACDEAGVKVNYSGAELMRVVSEDAPEGVAGERIVAPLLISVDADGEVRVRRRDDGDREEGALRGDDEGATEPGGEDDEGTMEPDGQDDEGASEPDGRDDVE